MHKDITIANNAKKTPETVFSYNKTKYGVDIVYQLAKKILLQNWHTKMSNT